MSFHIPKHIIHTVIASLLFIPIASGQGTNKAVSVEATYVGEGFSNFSGGLQTGQTYLGLIDFGLLVETSEAGLWNGGELYAQFEHTHGGSPSGQFIGDLQVASNIENGDYAYLYEFWYKQQVGPMSLQLGIIDLNADYFVAEAGGLFLNSSFGIQPSASLNVPVPIFPMNALGINIQYQLSDAISIQSGIWDGDPGNLDDEPYNTHWNLAKDQGFLSVSELIFNHRKINDTFLGRIKAGVLFHSTQYSGLTDSTITEKGNLQFHVITEQTLINKPADEKGKLAAFAQIGYLPNNSINLVPVYLGAGLNYTGILNKDASDMLGFAVAYSGISKKLTDIPPSNIENHELAIELTYSFPLTQNITIQPDIQYIQNPGANKGLTNAFIGFLRFYITTN